jgi:NADH-quinone oxidoreductase subunit L
VVNETASTALRWIPLLPLAAAVFHGVMIGLVRRSAPRFAVVALSCGSVGLAFLISGYCFFTLAGLNDEHRVLSDHLFTWFSTGVGDSRFSAEMALRMDPLSSVMSLVVTGVGFLIHVYSIGYMDDDHRDDRGFQRFFCYLNLFTFSMLVLVLGDNLVLMFAGWEGVGLCSYLLIGFWYSDRWNAYCGSKAFIVNRIGDFGFLIGIFLLFGALAQVGSPSVAFADIQASFDKIKDLTVAAPFWGQTWRLVDLIGLCFFVGAMGKSAQLPLYVWLPDAMAGPTPVSALIHAATMVTAGVYMVCRLNFLYTEAHIASAVVAWVGAVTALFAATIAVAQSDIKKVLAYSTVSQLGYMFVAAGTGAYTGAIFHLVTHAFFKALLFLAAGAVILAMHHEQDIFKMGGLKRSIRRTRAVFLVGVVAIAGFPPLSGFFSKDEILLSAYASHVPGHLWLYGLGLATAGLTSFYMFRLYYLVFHRECRAPADVREHIHEPPATVLHPLYVLAFLSIVGGLFGFPVAYGEAIGVEDSHSLANWLSKVVGEPSHHLELSAELGLAAVAIGVATVGWLIAYTLYLRKPELPAVLAAQARGLHALLANAYRVDSLYDALFVRPLVWLSDRVLFRFVDAGVIDGVGVNGLAQAVRGVAGSGLKYLHSGLAQSYVFSMLVGVAGVLWYLLG